MESTDASSVIVIGGGVGGLTAAHELVERGFSVRVLESRPDWEASAIAAVPGSAAAVGSICPANMASGSTAVLHARDRHDEADPEPGRGYVFDHLKPTTESAIALVDSSTWYRFYRGRSPGIRGDRGARAVLPGARLRQPDIGLFTAKILEFLTASDERRLGEYEQMSWWTSSRGTSTRRTSSASCARARTMVAMDPRRGSRAPSAPSRCS